MRGAFIIAQIPTAAYDVVGVLLVPSGPHWGSTKHAHRVQQGNSRRMINQYARHAHRERIPKLAVSAPCASLDLLMLSDKAIQTLICGITLPLVAQLARDAIAVTILTKPSTREAVLRVLLVRGKRTMHLKRMPHVQSVQAALLASTLSRAMPRMAVL